MNPHDGEPTPAGDPTTTTSTTPAPPATDDTTEGSGSAEEVEPLDLERIGQDLDGVEAALRRLDDGTYWTDEVTGATLPDELLAADPVARRTEG